MNKRRCGFCDLEVHRSSYCRHLRSEKHARNKHEIVCDRIREFINGEMTYDLCTSSGNEINIDKIYPT